jgi:hypothetical protein
MDSEAVHDNIDVIAALDIAGGSLTDTKAGLVAVQLVRGWLDARMLEMASRLSVVSSFPENDLSIASKTGHRSATTVLNRASTVEHMAEFGVALGSGQVSNDHIDVATRALRRLKAAERPAFMAQSGRLALIAARVTPEEFEKTVQHAADGVASETGAERLLKQKAAARARSWIDKTTGMWCLYARFDPETGVPIQGRIDTMLATKFSDKYANEDCPEDPIEKQDWLRAQALAALLRGEKSGAGGRPEAVVIIDTTSGTIRWPFGVILPDESLARFLELADVHWIDVHCGNVRYAEGKLNLGRETRLANRVQRRALGALYATCAIPGCCVRYENTRAHHVWFWEHGGPTDLANLLPLCSRHHSKVHHGGWKLRLGPDRSLTITFPDNTVMTTGPPTLAAA